VGAALLLWLAATPAAAGTGHATAGEGRVFLQIEVQASLLGNLGDQSINGTTFGPAVKAGYRWGDLGLFLSLEHNAYVISETGRTLVHPGVVNLGIGGEIAYAAGFLRASLTIGPSILTYETRLDAPGTTGFFFDLRPAGLRWAVTDKITLMFDPLSFALVAPVLTGIPLVLAEYRTTFTTEFRW
jgi:hypothetical protein